MDLAEGLPAISAAAVPSKRRSWPRAALAFRDARQWVITRPGSCGRGRGSPSSDGNVTTGLAATACELHTRGTSAALYLRVVTTSLTQGYP